MSVELGNYSLDIVRKVLDIVGVAGRGTSRRPPASKVDGYAAKMWREAGCDLRECSG